MDPSASSSGVSILREKMQWPPWQSCCHLLIVMTRTTEQSMKHDRFDDFTWPCHSAAEVSSSQYKCSKSHRRLHWGQCLQWEYLQIDESNQIHHCCFASYRRSQTQKSRCRASFLEIIIDRNWVHWCSALQYTECTTKYHKTATKHYKNTCTQKFCKIECTLFSIMQEWIKDKGVWTQPKTGWKVPTSDWLWST